MLGHNIVVGHNLTCARCSWGMPFRFDFGIRLDSTQYITDVRNIAVCHSCFEGVIARRRNQRKKTLMALPVFMK